MLGQWLDRAILVGHELEAFPFKVGFHFEEVLFLRRDHGVICQQLKVIFLLLLLGYEVNTQQPRAY